MKSAFNVTIIADERSGCFWNEIAQQTKKPVVLVCTSGSALLNYYPAYAETFTARFR
jgi:2-succinyl-5-enolpyruvyl-6-hydroxy-3-cyclohexene-1-carboxylate synthase